MQVLLPGQEATCGGKKGKRQGASTGQLPVESTPRSERVKGGSKRSSWEAQHASGRGGRAGAVAYRSPRCAAAPSSLLLPSSLPSSRAAPCSGAAPLRDRGNRGIDHNGSMDLSANGQGAAAGHHTSCPERPRLQGGVWCVLSRGSTTVLVGGGYRSTTNESQKTPAPQLRLGSPTAAHQLVLSSTGISPHFTAYPRGG